MYFLPFPEAPWDEENRVLPNDKSYAVSPPSVTKKYIDNQLSLTIFFCRGTLLTPYLV